MVVHNIQSFASLLKAALLVKADIGGPITRHISDDGAGLSIPARSSSFGPAGNGGSALPTILITIPDTILNAVIP